MWSIKEEEVPQISEKEPCTLASMSQTTMLGIISAEACASKRAMEILSLQADETEARLANENLTPEQFDTLIKCSKSRFFFIKQKSGRPFNRTASRFRKKTFAMPSASIV